jgi:putative transposase
MQRTSRCDPTQVSQWKRQLLDGAIELFTSGKHTRDWEEGQAKENELLQQYCYVAACRLRPAADGVGVAQKSLSRFDACELRKLVDHDHPEISI